MKKFKVVIFKNLLDVEDIEEFYIECESKEKADLIRYAYCVTFNYVGHVMEVK